MIEPTSLIDPAMRLRRGAGPESQLLSSHDLYDEGFATSTDTA